MELGAGLYGFQNTMHRGEICALLDQALTLLYTANLSAAFRQRTILPDIIAVECWLKASEGRKWTKRGRIRDGNGYILSVGKGVWILTKAASLW